MQSILRLEGDFVWHDHKETDETFIVLEGTLRIDMHDGAVSLNAGEMFVVPNGVQHKPYAEHEVKLLLIEPQGVLNTGHESGEWYEDRPDPTHYLLPIRGRDRRADCVFRANPACVPIQSRRSFRSKAATGAGMLLADAWAADVADPDDGRRVIGKSDSTAIQSQRTDIALS